MEYNNNNQPDLPWSIFFDHIQLYTTLNVNIDTDNVNIVNVNTDNVITDNVITETSNSSLELDNNNNNQ